MAKLRRKPAWLEIESRAVRTVSQLALIFRSRVRRENEIQRLTINNRQHANSGATQAPSTVV